MKIINVLKDMKNKKEIPVFDFNYLYLSAVALVLVYYMV